MNAANTTGEPLTLRVEGTLDGAAVARLHALLDAGDDQPRRSVLLDFTGVRDFDDEGYRRLIELQATLSRSARRSAYITRRPRIRGMIFKVIHHTQDENTRPVASETMAHRWLAAAGVGSYAENSLDRAKRLLARMRERQAEREAERRREA